MTASATRSNRLTSLSGPFQDVALAFRRWRFWTFLAWQDIKQRYRGSTIGPFWTVANVAITAAGIGILYSSILNQDADNYIPFLTTGLIVWFLISMSISDATQAFIQAASIIRQAPLPLFAFPLRVVCRHLIVFGHNALVYVAILIIFRMVPDPLWTLLGLALVVVNLQWIVILAALVGARYRDAAQIIQNLMTFLLFLSPIFWPPELGEGREALVMYNPVTHLLEVSRGPALGEAPAAVSLYVCITMAVLGWIVALAAFARFRQRIIYWL